MDERTRENRERVLAIHGFPFDTRGMKEVLEETAQSVQQLYRETMTPIAERYAFGQSPSQGELAGEPLVLFVGNHSSGKSTFINHFLKMDIQRTGMAPTDDRFTLLRYGEHKENRDGRAIVSNPELSFSSLSKLGPEFLSHFQMRLVPNDLLKEVTLVDTPGMIDVAGAKEGRGYDFSAAVRWFAERADVVLLFFDPERPGTTTETLMELSRSLGRINHKLLVVMNKMDQFRSMRDFARCYGTLCWNLGKVIDRKDIPQIYTTYIPVQGAAEPVLPLQDFDDARAELVDEIIDAPIRRVDNMLTQASHYGEQLKMHEKILDRAKRDWGRFRSRLWGGLVLLVALGLGVGGFLLFEENWLGGTIALVLTLAAAFGGYKGIQVLLGRREEQIIENLDGIFEEVYKRDLVLGNRPTSLLACWDDVKPLTRRAIEKLGMRTISHVRGKDLRRLNKALSETIPFLRAELHRKLGTVGGGGTAAVTPTPAPDAEAEAKVERANREADETEKKAEEREQGRR